MIRFWKTIAWFCFGLAVLTGAQIALMNYQTSQALDNCQRVKMVTLWDYKCFE
ncbi:hypothetical protein [Salinibius halmophilus]|uniref:hypothetical protein n=1 Tax=Salinibius halmophilus TaxID=1853216 RepID=UPI0013141437|nr:hypothetical protein [Salinibius halmophilus]